MGKKDKFKAAKLEESSSEEDRRKRKSPIEAVSDDDAEANEDLSLKIVDKFMQRTARKDPREDGFLEIVTNLKEERSKKEKKKRIKKKEVEDPRDDGVLELVTNLKEDRSKKEKKKKKNRRKNNGVEAPGDAGDAEPELLNCLQLPLLDNVKEKEKRVNDNAAEVAGTALEDNAAEVASEAVETNPVAVPDNAVLRKLLRGPRYFDPPDNSWGACYNCGEEGHTTVNCTSARRKKPCFVCGSFEHNAKQCSKGRDCFICKQHGHRAKDCPDRNKSSKLCLKCGDSGHEMFSCRNDYCPDDLKEIQCYICGVYGHICCKDYGDPGPRELSCYRCGLSGHTGLACSGSRWDTNDRSRWDSNDIQPASSCYKCGIVGHFARECTSSTKASKRNREPSTPKHKSRKEKWDHDHFETRSAPHDTAKTPKKKKSKNIEFSSPAKTKHRSNWITEDSEDHYSSKTKENYWRSPATPRERKVKIQFPNGDYAPSTPYSKKPNYHDSPSNGSTRSHQHRYSASRFGNDSNGGMGRNNDWW